MKQIYAWIRDPKNNWLKGMSKHCELFVLYCQNPDACDLYVKENTCLNCGISGCKFGRKSRTQGPTSAARSFYDTMAKWRKDYADYFNKLKSLTAYNRAFRTNGHFYLPYSFMSGNSEYGYPIDTQWVSEGDLTTEKLARICSARPRAIFGGELTSYQKEEVPKFIADLSMFYPEIFVLLPDNQKARLADMDYRKRKADITTCAPGKYVFSERYWDWDGEHLIGRYMLFQPVSGDIEIRIKPKAGEAVTITDNAQVTSTTRFLD